MALMEVQRYPDDFDAAIAGDPVIDRTKLMMSYTYNAQALARGPIPPSKIPVIEKATLAACRNGGGVYGDLITTPGRCKFDPRTIQCASGDGPNCLTAAASASTRQNFPWPGEFRGNAALSRLYRRAMKTIIQSFITGNGTSSASPSSTWKFQEVHALFHFPPHVRSRRAVQFRQGSGEARAILAGSGRRQSRPFRFQGSRRQADPLPRLGGPFHHAGAHHRILRFGDRYDEQRARRSGATKTPAKSPTLRACSWCPGCTIAEAVLAPPVLAPRIRVFPRSLMRSTIS